MRHQYENWRETIPQVADGPLPQDETSDLYLCKTGSSIPLPTQAIYIRAKLLAGWYPTIFRILRFAGHQYEPRFYERETLSVVYDYVVHGRGSPPFLEET